MNAEQRSDFHEFAEFCSRKASGNIYADAIVAASRELELLGFQRDDLLVACKALVNSSAAGLFLHDGGAWICGYCNASTIYNSSDIEHRHDCAILIARAAIASVTSDKEK